MGAMLPILRAAFVKKTGLELGNAEAYLLAMLALENAHGKAIWNYNWGNVIRWNDDQDYFFIGQNPREFRSLASHEQGAENFINTLFSSTNKRIVEAALDDDFEGFFEGIHTLHPETKKAYNYLTDFDILDSALAAYSKLVDKFKDSPLDEVLIGPPRAGTIKPTMRNNSSSSGVIILGVVSILFVGMVYLGKRK